MKLRITTPGAAVEILQPNDIALAMTKVALGASHAGAQHIIYNFGAADPWGGFNVVGRAEIDTYHKLMAMHLVADGTAGDNADEVDAAFYAPSRCIAVGAYQAAPTLDADPTARRAEPGDTAVVRVESKDGQLRAWAPMHCALEVMHDPSTDQRILPLSCLTFTVA